MAHNVGMEAAMWVATALQHRPSAQVGGSTLTDVAQGLWQQQMAWQGGQRGSAPVHQGTGLNAEHLPFLRGT